MKSFKDISINKQLLIPPLIILLLVSILSFISYRQLKKHLAALTNSQAELVEKTALVDNLIIHSNQVRSHTFQIITMLAQDCPEKSISLVRQQLDNELEMVYQLYGELKVLPTLDDIEREKLDSSQNLPSSNTIEELIEYGTTREINLAFEFLNSLKELADYQQTVAAQANINATQLIDKTTAAIVITSLVFIAIGTFSTVFIGGMIASRPIRYTIKQMQKLADGDMDTDIKYLDRKDEIGVMTRSIEILRKNTIEKETLTQELHKSAERFRELFNNMSSGVVVFEAINEGTDFIVKDMNKPSERASARKKEDVIGKSIFDAFPGTPDTGFDKVLYQVYTTGEPEFLPDFIYQDQHVKLWMEIYVYLLPSGEIVAVQDNITERRQAEERLAEHRRMLSTLMSNLPGMAYRCLNDEEWTMEFVSEGCQGLTGYMPSDLIYSKKIAYTDIIHPEDQEYVWNRVQAGLQSSGRYQLVYRIQTSKGKVKWVWEQGSGIFSFDGELISLEGFISDITERKLAEEALEDYSSRLAEMVKKRTAELEKAQDQLLRSEKLAVLGQLAGGIAHELRNPLGAIKNLSYYFNLALESPDEEMQMAIKDLAHEVNAADHIIHSLLDFARTRSLQKMELDINSVVMESLLRVSPTGNHEIEIVSHLEETVPPVFGDSAQLVQLFSNLIQNAMQAVEQPFVDTDHMSTDQDSDHLQFDNNDLEKRVTIRTSMSTRDGDSQWAEVSVSDTGVGIPPENLDKVFEPLFSTKAKGIGLGLALSKLLVEEHGGSITIKSEVGQGSTFTVSLPVYQPGAEFDHRKEVESLRK